MMSTRPSNAELLHPLSTQLETSLGVDSAVAMSAPTEESKTHDATTRAAGSEVKTDHEHDEKHVMVQEEQDQSAAAKASKVAKKDTGAGTSGEGSTVADISLLVNVIQRIVEGSSTNITLTIKDTSEDSSKEKADDDGEQDDETESSATAEGCQCTACVLEAKDPHKQISHAVDFRDDDNGFLTTQDLKTAWNSKQATKRISKHAASTAFTVTTVLSTSIPARMNQIYPQAARDLIQDKNTDIGTKFHTIKLTIASRAITQALRGVVLYYPDLGLRNDRLDLESPFNAIAHHIEELEEYRHELIRSDAMSKGIVSIDVQKQNYPPDHLSESMLCNKKSAEHLGALLNYLKESYEDRIREERALNEKGLCTFAMLWLMFKPGTTVYVRSRQDSESLPSAGVIKSVQTDPGILFRNDNERSPYKLEFWNLDFDGLKVGRCQLGMELAQFDGEKKITSLEIFPSHFLDAADNNETREKLIERGKRWFRLLKGKIVRYQGQFLDDTLSRPFDGRVYVDSTSFWRLQEDEGGCVCSVCTSNMSDVQRQRLRMWKSYDDIDPFETDSLELGDGDTNCRLGVDRDHRYLICTPRLGGLALKTRTWEKLDANYCSDIEPKSRAIDNLVMSKARKDMIKALLHNYSTPSGNQSGQAPASWSADLIEGKGDGRIFLLHGPPGVGKTYTAECIAEYTGRPLISLTCGDIGTEEQDVEEKLSEWFSLGEKWGAVMLIDEADIYLESRKPGDLKRNGLVSVFLRAVEYYKGILFLTTNRVGQFDDAFISRIHVVLRYEILNLEDRKKIWEGFFEKLGRERGRHLRITKRARQYILEDKEMTAIPWNGREIRNAFQTAVALAQYQFAMLEDKEEEEKATLDREHFEEVCAMTTHFKNYLKNVHKEDEQERAIRARNRNDEEKD